MTEAQRHAQAQIVNDFVDEILDADEHANVVVLGDINDFEFSETVSILEGGGVLSSLMNRLPKPERYSYVFEGNSQVLDQILVSENLGRFPIVYDVVHVNAEFADQASDHDPQVARLDLRGRPEAVAVERERAAAFSGPLARSRGAAPPRAGGTSAGSPRSPLRRVRTGRRR